jgi:hypothetical protein
MLDSSSDRKKKAKKSKKDKKEKKEKKDKKSKKSKSAKAAAAAASTPAQSSSLGGHAKSAGSAFTPIVAAVVHETWAKEEKARKKKR